MQAFGLNPVSNRDPWGRWVIPPDAGPAWNYNSSWGIPKIARGLLLTEVSLAYLSYRFGALAKKAGLDVKTEVEKATALNSGPRVKFDSAALESAYAGLFDGRSDTIVLSSKDQDPERYYPPPNPGAPLGERLRFRRALRIAIASTLGHETVHYLSKRITGAAWKGTECTTRGIIKTDPAGRPLEQPCWFLHDDDQKFTVDKRDIGDRWQYMLFGDAAGDFNSPWLVASDFDWNTFTKRVTEEYERLILRGLSPDEVQSRSARVASWLFQEWWRGWFYREEPEPQLWPVPGSN
jgi:hypothetical protein